MLRIDFTRLLRPLRPDTRVRVMIKCPVTHQLVATGEAMDRANYKKMAFPHNMMRCPECGTIHLWQKADAIAVEV